MERPARALATSRLRMWGYAAILTAFCFAQSAGRMVADTKFDLVTNPGKFLTGGLHLWDPRGRVRPAAEPGLRLRVADGAVLLAGRAGAPAAVGDPAAVVEPAARHRFRRHRPARPAPGPRLAHDPGAGRLRLRAHPADHHPAGRGVGRGVADGAGAVGAAAAGHRERARVGPPGGRAERARRCDLRGSERRRRGRGAPARPDLDPDPGGGAAEVAAARAGGCCSPAWRRPGGSGRCWCSGATARRSSTTSRTPPSPRSRPAWPAACSAPPTGSPTSRASTTRPGSTWSPPRS